MPKKEKNNNKADNKLKEIAERAKAQSKLLNKLLEEIDKKDQKDKDHI